MAGAAGSGSSGVDGRGGVGNSSGIVVKNMEAGESDSGSPDEEGDTLLHLLAVSDADALLAKLKSQKWRRLIDAVNDDRKTALHLAVMAQMIDAVEALLNVGASAGIPDREGNTALHLCCKKGFDTGFRAIISAMTRKTRDRPTRHKTENALAERAGGRHENDEASRVIRNVELEPESLSNALSDPPTLLEKLKQDADIPSSTLSSEDLGIASMTPEGMDEANSYLCIGSRGFPILDDESQYFLNLEMGSCLGVGNVGEPGFVGGTQPSYDEAESSKAGDNIDVILEKENYEGDTCAILATKSGSKMIIEQLYSLSVNLDKGDSTSGRTPLHHAVDSNDLALIKFLIENCAVDIDSKAFSGETPLNYAKERNLDAAADLLRSYGAA